MHGLGTIRKLNGTLEKMEEERRTITRKEKALLVLWVVRVAIKNVIKVLCK